MKSFNHGQLFYDQMGNILSIEGSQNATSNLRANYIYLKDCVNGWYTINGEKYIKLIKGQTGEWRNFKEQERLLNHYIREYKASRIFDFIQLIDPSEMVGIVDSRETLKQFMTQHNKQPLIDSALEQLGVEKTERDNVGMIGSFQVGQYSETSDIDLIFFFDEARNFEIFKEIQKIISLGNELWGKGERLRVNPLRFMHRGHEFCIHFSLPEPLQEQYYIDENETGVALEETFTICEISKSIYCPTILGTTVGESLILYNGADRGIFKKGDIVQIKGMKYEAGVVIHEYERRFEASVE